MTQIASTNNTPLIILAAGRSNRMGFAKGLLPYQDKFLLEHQLATFFECGGREVLLVVGHRPQDYTRQPFVKHYVVNQQLTIVTNHNYQQGPLSSLQAGLGQLLALKRGSGVIMLPVDVPLPNTMKLSNLIRPDKSVVIPTYQERGGHPIYLGESFCQQLITFDTSGPNARLDYLIRQLPTEQVLRVPVEYPEVRFNLNEPSNSN
ncbi:MAG: NTP transferase domain-containing protein [Bdellovibrionales bacterium]|jgi:CTP:molybdopterin cytidylyltransferase MocA|nr:NTP transferase domain-containing protein [Bdellovibrionales bacterium]MBT3525734.1 NTP transferase domain-containing protein [Bdellovibrionales bacterium]MBT7669665.1 NTP transferase domain-containing protein [Bdellovibrionales bacterium]MBT7765803.1 NTP transferase domain-containing protein [Bdellovibrionales bacterium]